MSHSDPSDRQSRTFGGKLVSISKLWRHATALSESAEMGALSQSALEAIPDALVIVDAEGRIALVNTQTETMFGYSREELVDQHVEILLPERFHCRHAAHRSAYLISPTTRPMGPDRELLAQRKDGGEFPVEIGLSPLETETGIWVISTLRDVTRRKRLEEMLKQQAAALAEENRRKDQFLAMLSHELRNPLQVIQSTLSLLRWRDATDPDGRHQLEVMERQVRQLSRLTEDLLDVARFASGKIVLRRQRVDLVQQVREAAEDRRSLLDKAGVSLLLEEPASPLWVEGDPTRLVQIVGNLLQNSAKFTDPGGQVTVQLTAEPPAWTTLTVRDTGIGIVPELLPRVFEPLIQADDSLSRSRGGLGLGLAMVKGLVELHGGEVWAHSPGLGRGTEIVIRLPQESGPDARPEVSLPVRPVARPGRILIIEDNALTLAALRKMLAQWGHEVAVAHTGPEGVAAARQFRPQVVLCDLGLPEMDGCAVARELRQDPTTRLAWLIAVTGYGAEADQRRSRDAGFDRHLVKPVGAADLRQLLAELLGS